MYDKLAAIEERYVEIETLLVDPDVYQDPHYAASSLRTEGATHRLRYGEDIMPHLKSMRRPQQCWRAIWIRV